MRRTLFALVVLVVLAGCGGNGGGSQAAATTTSTSTSTSTTPTTLPPTTTKPTNELGKVKTLVQDDGVNKARGKVTVLAYNDNATLPAYRPDDPRPGYKYVAIEVRVCPTYKNFPSEVTVSWQPWSLNGDDGATYAPSSSYSPDTLVKPLFPDEKATPIGTCRKGWIPFDVPDKWKPDYVEYNTDTGNLLTWRLQ